MTGVPQLLPRGALAIQLAMLTKPDEYAMVSVSTGTEPGTPQFHRDLAVDGAVVVSNSGPEGVLCSLWNW